jgi:NitT/TauT family transport system permease protein
VPRKAGILLGLIPILALVGLWWFYTRGESVEDRRIGPQILPSPVEVIQCIPSLLTERDLAGHVLASLRRVGLGYLVALAVALPLGIVMGSFGSFRASLAPTATASGYIPIATLVPLTMSWFGTGELQKVIFLAMAFGIYLLPLVVAAIENVPDVFLRTAYTLGASRLQTVFRVLVPIALPEIWHAMRLAFGVGWTYLVLTEVVVLTDGLGYLVAISQRRGPREHIYLVILVITIIAWIFDLVWTQLGRRLFPYQRSNP